MVNIFIIHGAYGSPEENWFPWLKEEINKFGVSVLVPKFPTPEGQSLENWRDIFEEYKKHLDEESIVVGHSLGPAFLLDIIEGLDSPIKAAFFVSGFTGLLDNPVFDKINRTFVEKEFDWKKIRKNCRRFYIFHSDNDPYVPLEKAEELAGKLDVEVILVKGAGHFNTDAGYTSFYPLLAKILKEIAPCMKILTQDDRGIIYDNGRCKLIMRKKGSVSGGHRHSTDEAGKDPEVLELIDGEVEAVIGEERSTIRAPYRFEIPAGRYHEFKAASDIMMIEYK